MIFHRRPSQAVAAPQPDPALVGELDRLHAERQELIKLCLYARDRLESTATARRIDERLEELGVVALVPDGQRFDPAGFEAAAVIETDDPELHDTVAATELPGYTDRGVIVREPVVSVYRADPAPESLAGPAAPPDPGAGAPTDGPPAFGVPVGSELDLDEPSFAPEDLADPEPAGKSGDRRPSEPVEAAGYDVATDGPAGDTVYDVPVVSEVPGGLANEHQLPEEPLADPGEAAEHQLRKGGSQ
ncbi:MAG: hypothetical protein ACR2F6_07955 [Mycobacteriales bacterium]